MKKKTKILISATFVLISSLLIFNCVFIDGSSIAKILDEYKNEEIVIIKYKTTGEKESETILDSGQKDALVELFHKTNFRKVLAKTLFFDSTARYEVRITNIKNEIQFNAGSMGGAFFYANNMFGGRRLKIYNRHWNEQLEEITGISDTK